MAKELTDILIAAIGANQEIMTITGSRVYDTANEVPDFEEDNTPCPYLIVVEKPANNEIGTKDWLWEGPSDHCAAGIIICADTPDDVRALRRKVRKAVEDYISLMARIGEDIPTLTASSYEGVAWDEMKPCYNDVITYQCDMDGITEDDEQKENPSES